MSTSTVTTIFGQWVTDIGTVLSDNLPTVLVVAASVFGLVLIVRLGKRFIAGR